MIDTILKPIKFLFKFGIFAEKENIESKILSVKDIYTPLSVAKEEVWRRWNDKELRKKVEDFLDGDVPMPMQNNPIATLVRHVASPNKELIHFFDLSNSCNVEPFCLEYAQDLYTAKNPLKYYLCKMIFHNGLGKKGGDKTEAIKVVHLDRCEGKKFTEINTTWNENFVDFHHSLLEDIVPGSEKKYVIFQNG